MSSTVIEDSRVGLYQSEIGQNYKGRKTYMNRLGIVGKILKAQHKQAKKMETVSYKYRLSWDLTVGQGDLKFRPIYRFQLRGNESFQGYPP